MADTLKAYVQINLKEEIQAEAKLTEVDFFVRRGKDLFAIEAKAGERLRPDDLR